MPLAAELREILVCPQCKGDLLYIAAPESLDCPACRLRYPVREGIPVMLVDEAEVIEDQGPETRGW